MSKIKIFIIALAIGIVATFGFTNTYAENNRGEAVILVNIENLTSDIKPVYIANDFALVYESDIPPDTKGIVKILPDQPGDYYIMRVISPEDLKPIEGKIPYFLIGENAIFRTDADGADILSNYGWGLTALIKRTNLKGPHRGFAPSTISEYDSDIENMISSITHSSCLTTVTNLTSFSTRYSYADACRQAEQYVYNQFASLPLSVSFHNFTYNDTPRRNVIGEMSGITQPNKVIIICGHLDSTSEDPWNNAPGAEDNGSGAAAVVEVARVLSEYQTDLTIRFITFSGEEQGLRGSYDYVDYMVDIGEDIEAVINLDMVAYQGSYSYDMHVFSDSQSHWLADLAQDTMSYYTSIIGVDDYNEYPQYGSDHYPFAIEGYPAIFFIDAWTNGEDWYPYYHTTNDIIDHLDMDLLADISRTGAATAAVLAVVHFETVAVPTLNEWGMIIFFTLIVGSAIWLIRRRNKYLSL